MSDAEWIRPLGPEDRSQVIELYEELKAEYAYPLGADWTPEKLKEELVAVKGWGLFASNGPLLAFVLVRPNPVAREVTLLATRKGAQSKGYMKRLMGYLLNLERVPVWLEAHVENAPALRLYRALGFQEKGLRKAYYRDGKDAILFEYQKLS